MSRGVKTALIAKNKCNEFAVRQDSRRRTAARGVSGFCQLELEHRWKSSASLSGNVVPDE
jgi:hypothetical protein